MDYDYFESKLNDAALMWAKGLGRDAADKMRMHADYMAGGRFVLDLLKQTGVL